MKLLVQCIFFVCD